PETTSGCSSSGEKRISLKAMETGAGRASALISVLGSSSDARVGLATQSHIGKATRRIFRRMELPEIIEVEPIVRCAADVMCEPVREPLDQPLQGGFPLLAVELDCIFEWLEMQIVAIASHVEPEAQHDRDFQCRRKLPRRGGEWRRGAEEIDVDHVVARTRAVHEQRYEGALVERFLDRER